MMGCYGLGVTRLIAATIEVLSKDDAIRWPKAISPFDFALLVPKVGILVLQTLHCDEVRTEFEECFFS